MKINEFLLAEQPPAMTTAEDPKDPKQLETVLNARKHNAPWTIQKNIYLIKS